KEDRLRNDYYTIPSITTANDHNENNSEMTPYTFEEYRHKLIDSILHDQVLTDMICERIVYSYSTDLVGTICTIVDNNFNNDLVQCQQAVEFVSR
ncbi:unnamed protein product, partial [Rotaria sp. Silwood1]